ncbi:hypothetical protein Q1695_007296 [Nippostrongylus brasiliensis]|nr:hypothetical protein Q1695_007296 [Nippostrongylus brasiliensis]
MAKERSHRAKSPRILHRTFGVTSSNVRKRTRKVRLDHTSVKEPDALFTSGQVLRWKMPTPVAPIMDAPHSFPPPIWMARNASGQRSVKLEEFFDGHLNTTVNDIKQYFRKQKKTRHGKKRAKQVSNPVPFLYMARDPETLKKGIKLNLKFIDPDAMAAERIMTKKLVSDVTEQKAETRPSLIKVMSVAPPPPNTSTEKDFVEKLAARIEEDEAERVKADANNPLKYTVKDGILYKQNKTPVARIGLKGMDMPRTPRVDGLVRLARQQTMVASSPLLFEATSSNHAATIPLRAVNSASPVLSAVLQIPQSSEIVPIPKPQEVKWRDEGRIGNSTMLSHGISSRSGPDDLLPTLTNDLIADDHNPPPYPFSHCYMNLDGFMCCNRFLESLMRRSFRKLRKAFKFHECSVQRIANRIQMDTELVFNTTFETIVGIDDFAIRAHFAGDLMCKIQEGGRFITAYATSMPSRIGVHPDPLNVVTGIEMNTRDNESQRPDPSAPQQLDGIVRRVRAPHQHVPKRSMENIPFHEKSREDLDIRTELWRT